MEVGGEIDVIVGAVFAAELVVFKLLARKSLYDAVALDVFLRAGIEVGEGVAHAYIIGMYLSGINAGEDEYERGYDHKTQREFRIDREARDGSGEKQHYAHQQLAEDIGYCIAHHIEVAGESRHEVAGAVEVKEAHLLVLHIGVKALAHIVDKALSRRIREDGAEIDGSLHQ